MFLETAEKLNTINKTVALAWGWLPTTVAFGLGLFLLLAIFLLYKSKGIAGLEKISPKNFLLILVVVAWWPMFAANIFASWQQIFQTTSIISAPAETKLRTALCAIDKNQEFSGSLCLMEPFIKEVKDLVPAHSKINIVSSGFFSLFLEYSLMSTYQISGLEAADYWLIYLSKTGYQINSNNELLEIKDSGQKNWGRFQVIKIINQNMVIIKRQ